LKAGHEFIEVEVETTENNSPWIWVTVPLGRSYKSIKPVASAFQPVDQDATAWPPMARAVDLGSVKLYIGYAGRYFATFECEV